MSGDVAFTAQELSDASRVALAIGDFTKEQANWIGCLGSIDLDASPGSGKTGALLGKLYLLSQRRTWSSGRSICVLSHTNNAVDEIKGTLARHSRGILEYPNFIGTLQEFVNRFLALPYYKQHYAPNEVTVDDDVYEWRLRSYLQHRYMLEPVLGKLNGDLRSVLSKSAFDAAYLANPKPFDLVKKDGQKNRVATAYLDARNALARDGFLTYADAVSLAKLHLTANPNTKARLRRRFSHIFLDEAQDTGGDLFDILDAIFDDEACCYQRIGDPQQDIYDGDRTTGPWKVRSGTHALTLTETHRFGPNIAAAASQIRSSIATGCTAIKSVSDRAVDKCYIIAFEDANPQSAVQAFKLLLRRHSAEQPMKDVHAVGTVAKPGSDVTRLSIGSYDPDFSRVASGSSSRKGFFTREDDFISTITAHDIESEGSSIIYRRMASLIRKRIGEVSGKYPELATVKDAMAADAKTMSAIRSVALSIGSGCPMDATAFNATLSAIAARVANCTVQFGLAFPEYVQKLPHEDPLPKAKTARDIPSITFGTVHSVKGSTVDALLLLTCQYQSTNAKPGTPKGTELDYLIKDTAYSAGRRRLIYVAMTRPRYLFAWAIPKSKISVLPSDLSRHFEFVEP